MKIAILVACFIGVAVHAQEHSAPGVCIYKNKKDYRCNGNERVSEEDKATIIAEINALEQTMNEYVENGDIDAMLTLYTDDVKYIFGNFEVLGLDELRSFLNYAVGSGGTPPARSNMQYRVLSHRHVMIVHGEFSVTPTGPHGVYYAGDMYRQEDGLWKLSFINYALTG